MDTSTTFSTISGDELSRIVRSVGSPTLVPLLSSKSCLFSRVAHLLISKLDLGIFTGVEFNFEDRTRKAGPTWIHTTPLILLLRRNLRLICRLASKLMLGFLSDLSLVKSVLENCDGPPFNTVSLINQAGWFLEASLHQKLSLD